MEARGNTCNWDVSFAEITSLKLKYKSLVMLESIFYSSAIDSSPLSLSAAIVSHSSEVMVMMNDGKSAFLRKIHNFLKNSRKKIPKSNKSGLSPE